MTGPPKRHGARWIACLRWQKHRLQPFSFSAFSEDYPEPNAFLVTLCYSHHIPVFKPFQISCHHNLPNQSQILYLSMNNFVDWPSACRLDLDTSPVNRKAGKSSVDLLSIVVNQPAPSWFVWSSNWPKKENLWYSVNPKLQQLYVVFRMGPSTHYMSSSLWVNWNTKLWDFNIFPHAMHKSMNVNKWHFYIYIYTVHTTSCTSVKIR